MHRRILVVQPYGTGSKLSENCKIVSVYSVCTVCVQCVYSVCTLCAAKPHRHRPELPEFASSEGCRPTNYALIMH